MANHLNFTVFSIHFCACIYYGYVNDPSGNPVNASTITLNGTIAQEAFESISIPTGTIYSGVVFTTSFYTSHPPNPNSFIGVTITQSLIDLIKQKVSGGSYWMKLMAWI